MSQKKWKINIIDIIAIIFILAVAIFLVLKLSGRENGGETKMVNIRYTVLCEDQPAEIYAAVQKYIPCSIMASGVLYDAQVTAAEAAPSLVMTSENKWTEDPDHLDITFTVEGQIEESAVLIPTIGAQEIRIGKKIILKTEYLEFDPAVVVDVSYN